MDVKISTIDTKLKLQNRILEFALNLSKQSILFTFNLNVNRGFSYTFGKPIKFTISFWVSEKDFKNMFSGQKVIRTDTHMEKSIENDDEMQIDISCLINKPDSPIEIKL